MSREYRIAVVGGDGIGPEVTREALKVLRSLAAVGGPEFEIKEYPFSADHFLATGETLPEGTLEEWERYDAIYMGAFGDPRPQQKKALLHYERLNRFMGELDGTHLNGEDVLRTAFLLTR